jgi:hypothetical protein
MLLDETEFDEMSGDKMAWCQRDKFQFLPIYHLSVKADFRTDTTNLLSWLYNDKLERLSPESFLG